MKRIVKEVYANGKVRYAVETNTSLGFIPCRWHIDTFYDAEHDMHFDARFETIEEAYSHIGVHEQHVLKSVIYP